MKNFIAKILIYFLIVGFISICLNYVYVKRNHSDPQNIRKFQSIPLSIKVCNFGSSHGLFGFNYNDVKGEECFNFALTSQSLSYDKRLFDYYKNNIDEGAVVFIPVSYFSLYGNPEITDENFANKNKRYYKILPPRMIKEYDLKTDIYVNYFPALSVAGVDFVKTLLVGSKDTKDVSWSRSSTNIDVKNDAELASERHIFKNKLDKNGNRILNQEEIDALVDLINACYEKGCTPILITTPYLREYTDEIKKRDPSFLDDFYDLINKIVDETLVSYYDYGFDERFISNYQYFMNSDHLNDEGACQFVNILMDEVVHYGTKESLIVKRD